MASLLLDDFSGGLNLRDSPNRISTGLGGKPAESPACFNWALTERGGIKRRNGHARIGTLPGTSGTAAYIFWSAALGVFVCARASGGTLKVFTSPTGATGTWTDRGTINSDTTAVAAFIDFPRAGAGAAGPAVVITTDKNGGATKGTWVLDSTFALAQATGGANIAGTAIALWQDRAIVAGYPTSDANGNPTRFFATVPKVIDFSGVGSWNNDVREKDANPLTGLGVVGGVLIVFKKDSTYRVNDSSSGSYTMIDTAVGAVNPRAIAALLGRLWVWAPGGIFECDSVGALQNVGDKLRPIYQSAVTDQASIIAGISEDHVMFAGVLGATAFSGANQIIDYAPTLRGAVLHTFANSSQDEPTSFANKDGVLYAALKDNDALFSMFTAAPGVDDVTGFTAGWRHPWLLPNGGGLARLQRLIVQGYLQTLRTQSITVKKDWDYTSTGDTYLLDGLLPTGNQEQMTVPIQALGHSPAFGLEFGIAGGSGAMSIRAIELVTTELQYPNPGWARTGAPNTPPGPRGGRGRPPPPPPLPPPAP